MRDEELSITLLPSQGHVTLRVAGEIDLSTASLFRDAALAALRRYGPVICLDLSGVGFMDSTGLEVLLATNRRATLEGGQLYLVGPSQRVARLLEVTGVDRLFTITDEEPTVGVS
jgi:anti-sigma B factor antagonist